MFLGTNELVYHYPTRSTAAVTHMMFLSWAGTTLADGRPPPGVDVETETEAALEALGRYHISHKDSRDCNLTRDKEGKKIIVIDFHVSDIWEPRSEPEPKKARTGEN